LAYIDTTDCFGTLHELGYAEAFQKPIALCLDPELPAPGVNTDGVGFIRTASPDVVADELWFARAAAYSVTVSSEPAEVLRKLLTPTVQPVLDSEAERRFWTAHTTLQSPALTGLVTQHHVQNYRLDFALPEARIGIEIDGHAYHSGPDAFHNDRVRQRRLEMEGWRLIRFSGREACNDPYRCVREAAALVTKLTAQAAGQ